MYLTHVTATAAVIISHERHVSTRLVERTQSITDVLAGFHPSHFRVLPDSPVRLLGLQYKKCAQNGLIFCDMMAAGKIHNSPVTVVDVTILIVDDDHEFRRLLKRLLEKDQAFNVVGEAVDGAEALEAARRLRPDIVLMDLVMPRVNGLDATRDIKVEHPDIKIIIFTQYQDEAYRRAATQSGADAFLPKRTRLADVLTTIRRVAEGVSGEKTS